MKKIIICISAILLTGSVAMAQSQQDNKSGNVIIDAATGLTQAEKDAGKPSGFYKKAETPVVESKSVTKNDPSKYTASGQPLPAGYVAPKAVENKIVSDKDRKQQKATGVK